MLRAIQQRFEFTTIRQPPVTITGLTASPVEFIGGLHRFSPTIQAGLNHTELLRLARLGGLP